MDQLLLFAQEKWYIILIAIVALWIVIKLVKTILKWVLILLIIGGVLYYGFNYKDEFTAFGAQVVEEVKSEALQALLKEMKEAEYEALPENKYQVTSTNIRLEGTLGEDKVSLYFKNIHIGHITIDETVQKYINEAMKSTKST